MKWPLIWARPFVPHYLKIWTASIMSIILGFFLIWASLVTTLTGFNVQETQLDGIALVAMPSFVLWLTIYVARKLKGRKQAYDNLSPPSQSLETQPQI